MSIHFVMVFKNKKTGQIILENSQLAGEGMIERMTTIVQNQCRSWVDEWELVAFSHCFIPA